MDKRFVLKVIIRGASSGMQGFRRGLAYSFALQHAVTKPDNASNLAQGTSQCWDFSRFPTDRIRNFCIIAHVDHGKSTLSDRLLECTGTVKGSHGPLILDRLQVEKERGITVKAQTASMLYTYRGVDYLLNLIDTPGHVDFSYEVARSLSACNGAILLVDANEGIQAQTVANFWLAFENDVTLVPVLNKIDLPRAEPDRVAKQIESMFDIPSNSCLRISAKHGTGVDLLLPAIIDSVPPPSGNRDAPFKGFIFDSWHEKFRGVFACIVVKDGWIERGQRILALSSRKEYEVAAVGIMNPDPTNVDRLYAGQVGYIVTRMKDVREAKVGDTLCWATEPVQALPGFKVIKPMVFAGLFPMEPASYDSLRSAIEKLVLNDPACSLEADSSPALGQGWRVGFLGVLHCEVFNQRLEQEYDESVILTAPSVPYKAVIKDNHAIRKRYGGCTEITIVDPTKFPDPGDVETFMEPVVTATIITPITYLHYIKVLCAERRGVELSSTSIDTDRVLLKFRLPLAEIIVDFYNELKALSSGYASFDYELAGYQVEDIAKLDVKLNGRIIEDFSCMVHAGRARSRSLELARKLRGEIPRQLYDVTIQVCHGGKILARQDVKALRKDVTAGMYGGDQTRKDKKLAQQKEGKQRLKMLNQVQVPKEAFLNILKR